MDDHIGKEMDEMCNLSMAIEERGIEKGIARGIERGKVSCEINIIRHKTNKGYAVEAIADWIVKEVEYINEIQELLRRYPDDSDVELARRYFGD